RESGVSGSTSSGSSCTYSAIRERSHCRSSASPPAASVPGADGAGSSMSAFLGRAAACGRGLRSGAGGSAAEVEGLALLHAPGELPEQRLGEVGRQPVAVVSEVGAEPVQRGQHPHRVTSVGGAAGRVAPPAVGAGGGGE